MYSTVPCAEEYQSATSQHDTLTGKVTASVTLRCYFNDREALVADILGNRRVWPKWSGANAPVATTAVVRDAPGTYATVGQLITPGNSLVTVNYGTLEHAAVGAFDVVSESIEPAAEFQTLDYRNFRWGATDGPPLKKGEEPGKLNVKVMLTRRIFKVPLPLHALVMSAIGSCNLASYASPLLGITFAAETLLYMEPSIERTLNSSGVSSVNLTQKWMFNPNGWNKYWRAETESWSFIYPINRTAGGAAYKSYPPLNVSALLL